MSLGTPPQLLPSGSPSYPMTMLILSERISIIQQEMDCFHRGVAEANHITTEGPTLNWEEGWHTLQAIYREIIKLHDPVPTSGQSNFTKAISWWSWKFRRFLPFTPVVTVRNCLALTPMILFKSLRNKHGHWSWHWSAKISKPKFLISAVIERTLCMCTPNILDQFKFLDLPLDRWIPDRTTVIEGQPDQGFKCYFCHSIEGT